MTGRTPWQVVPVLGARDVEATAAFYRDILGFELTSLVAGVGEEGAVYALLQRDGVEVHLQIRRRELGAARERIERDVYVRVPDADAAYRELCARGARPKTAPQRTRYGLREFELEDPNGVRVSFGSP